MKKSAWLTALTLTGTLTTQASPFQRNLRTVNECASSDRSVNLTFYIANYGTDGRNSFYLNFDHNKKDKLEPKTFEELKATGTVMENAFSVKVYHYYTPYTGPIEYYVAGMLEGRKNDAGQWQLKYTPDGERSAKNLVCKTVKQ